MLVELYVALYGDTINYSDNSMGSSPKLGSLFRSPYGTLNKKAPKRDPNLENYPCEKSRMNPNKARVEHVRGMGLWG